MNVACTAFLRAHQKTAVRCRKKSFVLTYSEIVEQGPEVDSGNFVDIQMKDNQFIRVKVPVNIDPQTFANEYIKSLAPACLPLYHYPHTLCLAKALLEPLQFI